LNEKNRLYLHHHHHHPSTSSPPLFDSDSAASALCDAIAALHAIDVAHGPVSLDDVYLLNQPQGGDCDDDEKAETWAIFIIYNATAAAV
jgi:hypothetical protein